MKLLLLITNLGGAGAERQLVNLGVLFKQKGIDVDFLVHDKNDFFKSFLSDNNISVHQLNPKNNFHRIFQVRKYIRNSGCDVVISFLDTNNLLACLSAIGGKKWKLITNELSSKTSTFDTPRGKLITWFQRYSDKIVCNSYNAKKMWGFYKPSYIPKLSVIYNPVIISGTTSKYVYKRDGKLHIVVAASYRYLKNSIGLINALSLLKEEDRERIIIDWYGGIKLTENSNFPAYDDSIKLIKSHNLQNSIRLHDTTQNIINIMNEADVVALFSEVEGLPNAICEGMTVGKPIIMTRVSDYNTLVDETNGFLCDWDNSESIKDALLKAAELSEEQLIKMGENSKEKANLLFHPETIIQQWLELIN